MENSGVPELVDFNGRQPYFKCDPLRPKYQTSYQRVALNLKRDYDQLSPDQKSIIRRITSLNERFAIDSEKVDVFATHLALLFIGTTTAETIDKLAMMNPEIGLSKGEESIHRAMDLAANSLFVIETVVEEKAISNFLEEVIKELKENPDLESLNSIRKRTNMAIGEASLDGKKHFQKLASFFNKQLGY